MQKTSGFRYVPQRSQSHSSSAPFPIGGGIFVGLLLNDLLGFWGSVVGTVVTIVLAALLLRPVVRRSRRRRVDANIEKGVVEALVRFTDDDDGRSANHGWKEGALFINSNGLAFQQLQGPGGKPIGTRMKIGQPTTLGRKSFNPEQAPGLDPGFAAFGFLVEQRELEIVVEPAYLKYPQIQSLLAGEAPSP